MVDYTKAAAQLMDWTELDDTGGVPSLETSELSMADDISVLMHIDVCHKDTNDAGVLNNAVVVVWIKSGTTDEDWHELVRFTADGGYPNEGDVDQVCASGQPNVYITATANFDNPGDIYFLLDVGTLADSCLIVNKDVAANDYIICIDNLVNAYDASDLVYDKVNQWNVPIPADVKAARVTFHNPDNDATYACRVRYSKVTDVE